MAMGTGNKVKVSQIIVNQLPEFIKDTIKVVEEKITTVSKNGSYTRNDRIVTIISANHELYLGDRINIEFISGSATSDFYNVYEIVDSNTFKVVDIASGTTSGSLRFDKVVSFSSADIPPSSPGSYDKFISFLRQYYISQEYQGGPIDIIDNLNDYLSLDNLILESLAVNTILSNNISIEDDEILVASTKGYPDRYGLLKIDDEIITYTSKNATKFFGCIRGFSGVTSYHEEFNSEELVFSKTDAAPHISGSTVENLSTLFLKEFFGNIKYSLVPGLETVEFYPELNIGNFLKEARSLYECKGTEESFKILFRVLYGIDVNIIDLEQFIIKPSSAKYFRREICYIDSIVGNPANLKGQIIRKNGDSLVTASISDIEPITRENKTYYKVYLFVGYDEVSSSITGNFSITPSSKVSNDVFISNSSSEVINVDSTVGFPPSGYFYYEGNKIYYSDKSVNQFFDCYSESGTIEIKKKNNIVSSETYYAYENGDITKRVEFRVTGTIKDIQFEQNVDYKEKFNYIVGDEILVKNLGEVIKNPQENKTNIEIFSNSLIYNTNCRFIIDSESINGNQFSVFTDIDKSNLKIGDKIEILERGTQLVVPGLEEVVVTSIVNRDVVTDKSIFSTILALENKDLLVITEDYDFRRLQNTAYVDESADIFIKYGNNKVLSNILNLYKDNEDLYIASNSLPDYKIETNLYKYTISHLEGYNSETEKYSILTLDQSASFLDGDAVSYIFDETAIEDLDSTSVYYVKVISEDKRSIRLYTSLPLINTNNYYEFGNPLFDTLSGNHNIILFSQKEQEISPQKLLRKFNTNFNDDNINDTYNTPVGPVGMLVNGVEILSYKTNDKIYYGPIESVQVFNGGLGYDVINPPVLEFSYGDAKIQPVISGSVEKVFVSKQEFSIGEDVKVSITGGNGIGAILEPVVKPYQREINFDARLIQNGGGIDVDLETITFLLPHSFSNGQEIIYDSNGNRELGISEFKVSNADTGDTLVTNSSYFIKVINDKTIQLYPSLDNYVSGINTIGITTIGNSGIHKFKTKEVNTLSEIIVIDPGSGYTNRKLIVSTDNISTFNSTINFDNHGFSDGELISYSFENTESEIGVGIVGLSTLNNYYILNSDKNSFQLVDAGIGGTSIENFNRGKIVKFGSSGSGYQVFKYPNIELNIEYSIPGIGSTAFFGTIEATPVVRGEIVDVYVYESGQDYGSTIVNLKNPPKINIKNGKSAQFKPIISSGEIIDVQVQYGGVDYYSYPDLEVFSSSGKGVVLKPILLNNKIVDVEVLNSGSGYEDKNTTIVPKSAGINANLNAVVRSLTINNAYKTGTFEQTDTLNQFYRKISSEIVAKSNNGLQYAITSYSSKLANIFNDSGNFHSPIIGWAFDGNPIYGPYGYSDPDDSNSPPKELISGYKKTNVYNRPSNFDDEFFLDDFIFDNSGDLDQYNGRYCKTPEFPNGVYAYFATIKVDSYSDSFIGSFPYFIGPRYRSYFNSNDLYQITQDYDFNSSNLIRNTLPYKVNDKFAGNDFIVESNELLRQKVLIESIKSGKIDSFDIINGGANYKIGDKILFNEPDVNILAKVSEIGGKEILDITTTQNTYNNSIVTWQDSKKIKISIPPENDFENDDTVILSGLSTNLFKLNGSHKIGVQSNFSYLNKDIGDFSTTGIVTTISLSYIPENISVGSSLNIENEIFGVLNVYESLSALRVSRVISGAAHTSSTLVNFFPNSFTIDFESDFFDSKLNEIVYFNPTETIGVGTTPGITKPILYYINDVQYKANVPTQAIFLPNHPFKTNDKVILSVPPNLGPFGKFTVRNTPGDSSFNIPISGDQQELYVINYSKDYIGIVTNVGLTSTSKGLFFTYSGFDSYYYNLRTDYTQEYCNIERFKSKVVTKTQHNLTRNDKISLSIKPSSSGASSTIFYVKYNISNKLILLNERNISSGINITNNTISYNSHGYKTGQKVYYDSSDSVASGLNIGIYYILKIDDNSFKLCETYNDAFLDKPNTVNINTVGGNGQTISEINPKLSVIKNNNLVFDLSDPSLAGYELNLYYDNSFNKQFILIDADSSFNILRVGIPGVTPNASLTLKYSDDVPKNLFYNLDSFGIGIIADKTDPDYSKIEFIDSNYNGSYSVYNTLGAGSTSFSISLYKKPEVLAYTKDDCDLLEYKTNSKSSEGSIKNIKIYSSGNEYDYIPTFAGVSSSSNGIGAYIVPQSKDIGLAKDIKIVTNGFDYPSDKTLRPTAAIPYIITLKNSETINSINVIYGGNKYLNPPDVVVINTETLETIDTGILIANLSGLSIGSIDVDVSPKQLPSTPVTIKTINNTNGISISEIQSSNSGIVTCILTTPIAGFSTDPFSTGDKIFVEGIQKYGSGGDGFNSSDYGYQFFEVSFYESGSNPGKLIYDISSFTNNPGIAKTIQDSFAAIINYDDYPRFEVIQTPGKFFIGESIYTDIGYGFEERDLNVKYESGTFLRLSGTYELSKNEIIRGKESYIEGVVSDFNVSNEKFNISSYSSERLGWFDNIGKLNESTQVISDNDYYQNLSYSIKSTKEWDSIESIVNNMLHTSGLKNFADTEFITSVQVRDRSGISTAIESQLSIINDNINEVRVDTINYFDLVVDANILSN